MPTLYLTIKIDIRKYTSSTRSYFAVCDVAIRKKHTNCFTFQKVAFCDE